MGFLLASSPEFGHSAQLLRNIEEARKTAFLGDTSSNGKELLLALIRLIAFDFTKGSAPRCASRSSRLSNLSHVRSYVPTRQQSQSTLRNNAFVITIWNEEIKTSRTPYRDLCVRQRPSHGDGIGEQQSSANLQHARPLRNDAW